MKPFDFDNAIAARNKFMYVFRDCGLFSYGERRDVCVPFNTGNEKMSF